MRLFLPYSNLLSCIDLPLFPLLDFLLPSFLPNELKKKKKVLLVPFEITDPISQVFVFKWVWRKTEREREFWSESSFPAHFSQISFPPPKPLPHLSGPLIFIICPLSWSLQAQLKDRFCFLLSPTYANLTCILLSTYVSRHSALPCAHSPFLHHKRPETSLVRVRLSLKFWEIEEKNNSPAMSFGRRWTENMYTQIRVDFVVV